VGVDLQGGGGAGGVSVLVDEQQVAQAVSGHVLYQGEEGDRGRGERGG
jgi:hypothetical protein